MSHLLVFCPTRGRPASARGAYHSFLATVTSDSKIIFVIDDDEDPSAYDGLPVLEVPKSGSMNGALQLAVELSNTTHGIDYYGFIGDDHRFRTPGWDRKIMEVLDNLGGGFAYANDLLQGENLPTQVFVSVPIVKALGWFGLRGCKHLYLDNAWKILGDAADCLYYFPNVIIEHMHPTAGKAEWDEAYKRVNDSSMYQHDCLVYEAWLADGFAEDIKTVQAALRG